MDESEATDGLPDEGGRRTFETDFEGRPPSIAVVEAIAAIEGAQPTDVDFSLYDSVDPDALDDLFGSHGDPAVAGGDEDAAVADGEVVAEFDVEDYAVRVRDDGRITVVAPEASD